MSSVHVHLALVHFPVVGLVLVTLLLGWGLVRGSEAPRRIALAGLVLVALLALPAYFTGDSAEDAVERLPGVSEAIVDRHEEAARAAFIAAEVLGAVALIGALGFARRRPATWFVAVLFFLSLASTGLMAWAANLGGQIRHTEIRAVSAAPARAHEGRGTGSHGSAETSD
jgi:formate hydrogenlyase subunit 3/multisubunit Na+/H+ antiporter MnhD subunit